MEQPIKFCVYHDDDYEDEDEEECKKSHGDAYEKGKMNILIFGVESQIEADCVDGEYEDDDNEDGYSSSIPNEMGLFSDLFNDTTMLCEDYLIHTKVPIEFVRLIVEKFGYEYDERLKTVGWG